MATNRARLFSDEERMAIAEGLRFRAKHYEDCANILRDRISGPGDEEAARRFEAKAEEYDDLAAELQPGPREVRAARLPKRRHRVLVRRASGGVRAQLMGGSDASGSNATEAIGALVRSHTEAFGVDLDFEEGTWPANLIR